ncbi:MAG TPA: NADH-quinone oxidoreductase subunit J [Actinomycetota bacterium]|nr:NADH-quinone oxidoreductase subunit J [Actinomycetota bacterium]
MEQWIFWIVAPVSLGSAIAMLLARNTVHSAMLLVINFFTLAVFYVVNDADFLAAVQIIVYAGAIMVLFLFVIMLIADKEEDLAERIKGQRTTAVLLGIGLAGLIVFTIRTALSAADFRGLGAANTGGNVEAIGRVLFTEYLWPFEITSLLLIVAAIAAIVIGRRPGDDPDDEEIEPGAAPAQPAAEPEAVSLAAASPPDHVEEAP